MSKQNLSGGYPPGRGPNPIRALRRHAFVEAPPMPPIWTQDEDCVGQEDPVTLDVIQEGKGFRVHLVDANNNVITRCYDADMLAQMLRNHMRNNPRMPMRDPMTRIEFSLNDVRRINDYIRANPRGGKKRKTRKNRKTKRSKRVNKRTNKKRNTNRRIKKI